MLIIKLFAPAKRHVVLSSLIPFTAYVVIRRIAYPYSRIREASFRYDSTTIRQYDSKKLHFRFRDFPLIYRREKTRRYFIPTANERLFSRSITTFSGGGHLWPGVASQFDIQRITKAGNFAA